MKPETKSVQLLIELDWTMHIDWMTNSQNQPKVGSVGWNMTKIVRFSTYEHP